MGYTTGQKLNYLGFDGDFVYGENMKITKDYIKEQIDAAVSQKPGHRSIGVVLKTSDPKRSFLISYDAHTQEIKGIWEKLGRTSGHPVDISVVLKASRPND